MREKVWKGISLMYSFERVFGQLFGTVYENFIRFVVFGLEVKMWEKNKKMLKSNFCGPALPFPSLRILKAL
jgi:hypothetical protein